MVNSFEKSIPGSRAINLLTMSVISPAWLNNCNCTISLASSFSTENWRYLALPFWNVFSIIPKPVINPKSVPSNTFL